MSTRYERYVEYLQSEHWSALRQLKFSLSGRRCQCCGCMSGINVHHIRYKNLTDCAPIDLLVLCRECHDILHLVIKSKGLEVEQQELAQVLTLVNEYKQSSAYPERKLRIKNAAKTKEAEKVANPPIRKFLKSEKKEIKRRTSMLMGCQNKVEGLAAMIVYFQSLIEKRRNSK